MIILVTGGCGFIGSHLIDYLVKDKKNHVICVDNNYSGSLDNIAHLRHLDNFEYIRHDITLPLYLEVDQIYHLACPASPKKYQLNGIKTIKTNVYGTMNMLGLAKRTGARILLTSTSEVYGDPNISPQTEEYWGNVNPIGIRSCYDEGKRIAETLMIEYHKKWNVDIRIARIFNTYGPRLAKEDGRVVSNFICQALLREDITIYGNGAQTRSFCYVDDTVNGLVKLMHQVGYFLPINIGNPDEYRVAELAGLVKELCDSTSAIRYEILPQDDPKKRKPDISKAKDILGWEPHTSLKTGLNKTISYFQEVLSLSNTT
tara:strand:- start:487 stop:1434 length:948 start_codon:yes stop_codon:yes gene_type:complete